MGLLGFLFGRQTNIFNKKGRVVHDLGNKKWEDWNNRLKENPDYDWTQHSGREKKSAQPAEKPVQKNP